MKESVEGRLLRTKAENILAGKKEIPPEGYGDIDKLIHEFEVYQIELEMQNDELRKAQADLEESRSRYVELFDFAPVGYFTLDNKGLIVEANLTGASLLGVERKLLPNTPFLHFIIPENRDQFYDYRRKVFQNLGKQSCELRVNRKANRPIWVRLEGIAVEAPEGKLTRMRMAANEITEYKRSEEALRESEKRLQDLSAKLLSFQEMDRKVIANEIHDGLLSDLSAVSFSMEANILALERANKPIPPNSRKPLEILQRTIKEARRIMDRLRPSLLDDLGLIPAVNDLCRENQMLYPHIQVECNLEIPEKEIPDLIKVVIFRVVQEAFTNFAKHGKGSLAKLSLAKGSNRIELMVQDNGLGFDLEKTKRGLGLESMQERVELSNGKFQIESNIGQGTTIRASWST